MLLFATREQLRGQRGLGVNDVDVGSAAALPFLPPPPECSSTARALNVRLQDWFAVGMDVAPVRYPSSKAASEECNDFPRGLSKASSLAVVIRQETSGSNHKIIVLIKRN